MGIAAPREMDVFVLHKPERRPFLQSDHASDKMRLIPKRTSKEQNQIRTKRSFMRAARWLHSYCRVL